MVGAFLFPPRHPPPSIPPPLALWPYVTDAHLKKSPEKKPYMNYVCLLQPIQDGQMQPAARLNWQHTLKWYFSKVHVARRRAFPDLLTYRLATHIAITGLIKT